MNGILSRPPQPGLLRTCPACGTHFALEFRGRQPHDLLGHVDTFRCRRCDGVFEYAERLPKTGI